MPFTSTDRLSVHYYSLISHFLRSLSEKFLRWRLYWTSKLIFFPRFTLDKTQIKYWFKHNRGRTSSLARARPWAKWHRQDQRLIGCPKARPPPPPPPSSVGACANNCVLFRGYRRDISQDSGPVCELVCDLGPLRARSCSPSLSCDAIKWGGHMAGHVSTYGSGSGGI